MREFFGCLFHFFIAVCACIVAWHIIMPVSMHWLTTMQFIQAGSVVLGFCIGTVIKKSKWSD